MERYKNLGNTSGVVAYESGVGFIKVQFSSGKIYLYTNEITGSQNIEKMKELATAGMGLNSFINKYVRKLYADILS